MSLADSYPSQSWCSGNALDFGGLSEVVDRIETFLRRALPRIIGNLRGWENGSRRNEKRMAGDLSIDLNYAATNEVFSFIQEDPENESATRTLDSGIYPKANLLVQGVALGSRTRLYGIEAKRLPTHDGNTIDLAEREREYVVGDWAQRLYPKKRLSGGIERMKECLHAADLDRAGMIAFVQREEFSHWHGKVNEWIEELTSSPLPRHQAPWTSQDQLLELISPGTGVSEFESTHERSNGSTIHLRHFWLNLKPL